VIFLSYAIETEAQAPFWVQQLRAVEKQANTSLLLYVTGTRPSEEVLVALRQRPASQLLPAQLAQLGLPQFVRPLQERTPDSILSEFLRRSDSMEFRVLWDLFVLSRSSALVADLNTPSCRGGVELALASGCIPVIGVNDSLQLDPYAGLLVDVLVRSGSKNSASAVWNCLKSMETSL